MKKIIALACSPNTRGNSDTLLDQFILGAQSTGVVEVEKMYINDIPMHYYDYPHKYPDPSEEPEFYALCEQLKNVDGLVIATPTFNFSVPSNLKNFIDRIGFLALDYENLNRMKQPTGLLGYLRNFYIVTGGSPNIFQKLLPFLFPNFLLKIQFLYYGVKKQKSAYFGSCSHSKPVCDSDIEKAKKLGEKYSKGFTGD